MRNRLLYVGVVTALMFAAFIGCNTSEKAGDIVVEKELPVAQGFPIQGLILILEIILLPNYGNMVLRYRNSLFKPLPLMGTSCI